VRSIPPSATGSRQQTAQPSLGLRGKRARKPVPPSQPGVGVLAAEPNLSIARPPPADHPKPAAPSPCADSAGVIWYRTKNGQLGGFKNNQFFRVEMLICP